MNGVIGDWQQAEVSAGSDALLRQEHERLEEVRAVMAAL